MKRKMRFLLTMLLCAAILCGCIVTADAALPPMMIGDADFDQSIEITDATAIQRYIVGLYDEWRAYRPDELYEAVCDADGDGSVTILDATTIQRMLAQLPNSFVGGEIWDYYIYDMSWHSTAEIARNGSDYIPGETCYVGVPVSFTAQVRGGTAPRKYALYLDGELIAEQDAAGDYGVYRFSHTFTEAGDYEVTTTVECTYGAKSYRTHKVKVIPLPEDGRPVVMGAAFFDASQMESGDGVLTLTAAGGTAPYQYKYELYSAMMLDEYELDITGGSSDDGMLICSTDYIDQDFFDLASVRYSGFPFPERYGERMRAVVSVRDANGIESEPVTVEYVAYQLIG